MFWKLFVWNWKCSSFKQTLIAGCAVEMALSEKSVDNLCYRLKALGAPKVHREVGFCMFGVPLGFIHNNVWMLIFPLWVIIFNGVIIFNVGYYLQCAIAGAYVCSVTSAVDGHPIAGMAGEGSGLLWAHKENIMNYGFKKHSNMDTDVQTHRCIQKKKLLAGEHCTIPVCGNVCWTRGSYENVSLCRL